MTTDRLREPATYWTPERAKLFAKLRNNRAPLARFRKEFGLETADQINATAHHLRERGHEIAKRTGRRPPNTSASRHRWTDPAYGGLVSENVMMPVTLMRADGTPFARIEAGDVTRTRRPIRGAAK